MLDNLKVFHIIGIGGISLSAIAEFLISDGKTVQGSDEAVSSLTENLKNKGVKVFYGHEGSQLAGADAVIYSSAIKEDNPEMMEARARGLPIFTRAEILGIISKGYKKVIAVSGSHGKTTTTGMLSTIFINAGLDPAVHIGGELRKIGGNVRISSQKQFFITEACEYKDSFLTIKPDSGIILNIQPDHMDYFKTFDKLINSFTRFARGNKKNGYVYLNADDRNCAEIADIIPNTVQFSVRGKADYYASCIHKLDDMKYSFIFHEHGKKLGKIFLSVYGKHNISNALVSAAVARGQGVDFDCISSSLEEFQGVGRRFEYVAECNGGKIFQDYAHHPTEISASIKTAKGITRGKVVCIFQPHTYSRTKEMWEQFARALALADETILYPIYAARETPIPRISSYNLAKHIAKNKKGVHHVKTFSEAHTLIRKFLSAGDICLILGAGNICDLSKLF